MKKANICVIGAGRLGRAAIAKLSESNHNIIVIDKNEENLKFIKKYATINPIIMDASDIETMRSEVGLEDIDAILVTTSDNTEIIATILEIQSESNLPKNSQAKIVARAVNKRHARVLKRIGVDWIISPEEEAGTKMAILSTDENVLRYADALKEVSEYFFIGSVHVKSPDFINKSIRDINLRNYDVSIVIVERNHISFLPSGDTVIKYNDKITVIGNIKNVTNVLAKLEQEKKI